MILRGIYIGNAHINKIRFLEKFGSKDQSGKEDSSSPTVFILSARLFSNIEFSCLVVCKFVVLSSLVW